MQKDTINSTVEKIKISNSTVGTLQCKPHQFYICINITDMFKSDMWLFWDTLSKYLAGFDSPIAYTFAYGY